MSDNQPLIPANNPEEIVADMFDPNYFWPITKCTKYTHFKILQIE